MRSPRRPSAAGPRKGRDVARAVTAEPLERRRLMAVVVGLQPDNVLVAFDSATPRTVLATVRVKGLELRENLLGIDFRPATGELYGLGSGSRLYTIDLATGRATISGTRLFAVRLNGTDFGFDFDPASDRARVVSDADQNLRLIPESGDVVDADPALAGTQPDAPLAYAATDPNAGQDPAVIGIAHAGDVAGETTATASTLYGIDASRDVLVRQGSPGGTPAGPGAGTLFAVGPLGVDVEPVGDLDIVTSPRGDPTALAALTTNLRRASQLYTIDLATGAATPAGNIGRGRRATLDLAPAPAGTPFVAVTARNELIGLNTAVPSLVLSRRRITGLASHGERVLGIDVRPADGRLWALTDAGRLYTVDPSTGDAAAVGGPSGIDLAAGAPAGFDVDPAADRIRVANSAGQNVRFDPGSGSPVDSDPADPDPDPDAGLAYIAGDPNAGAAPRVVGVAHGGNVGGAPGTTAYAIDSAADVLATLGSGGGNPTSPDGGQLVTVGPTGVDVPDALGFDIVTRAGIDAGLAIFTPARSRAASVFSVNLASGAVTLLSRLNNRVRNVIGMAILAGS